jgi:N-acetylglutamate synthase-like GNAT family acetyltransferase
MGCCGLYSSDSGYVRVAVNKTFRFHKIPETSWIRLRLKCDGICAETIFRLSAKRTSTFKSAGASVQSTTGSPGVRISGSNAGYTMFRGSAKSTGYSLHSPVFPSLPLPCVTVCHHISNGVYNKSRTFRCQLHSISATLAELSCVSTVPPEKDQDITLIILQQVLSTTFPSLLSDHWNVQTA